MRFVSGGLETRCDPSLIYFLSQQFSLIFPLCLIFTFKIKRITDENEATFDTTRHFFTKMMVHTVRLEAALQEWCQQVTRFCNTFEIL